MSLLPFHIHLHPTLISLTIAEKKYAADFTKNYGVVALLSVALRRFKVMSAPNDKPAKLTEEMNRVVLGACTLIANLMSKSSFLALPSFYLFIILITSFSIDLYL